MKTFINFSVLFLFIGAVFMFPAAAEAEQIVVAPSAEEIQTIKPADVFVLVAMVRDELELIRFEMGKPLNQQPKIEVANAAPREVFFQALTLFRKADRLAFEQARQRVPVPVTPQGELSPAHVYVVVDASLQRIRRVKVKLGITERSPERPHDSSKQSNDVFRSIVQANRQLNLLLDRSFAPSDVFRQVTSAVSYTSVLLSRFSGVNRLADAPPFERGKRPANVYARLVGVFEMVRETAQLSGLNMLELASSPSSLEEKTPSDVYDIASLLVSELAYLHQQVKQLEPPQPVYYPGRKLPADVYQRAGILDAQMATLLKQVKAAPNWLRDGGVDK